MFAQRLFLSRLALRTTIAAASFLPASLTLAQTVVITGAREPLSVERLAADVVVIDVAALRDGPADSLADLLRREAGLQLGRNGGPGHSSTVFLRGASGGQNVVLVDGVRIGSATTGGAPLESLGLAQIDRIEVLRGPGSSLYGADALGGVIQVFTRRGDGPARFDARVAVGGYNSRELSGGVSGGQGAWDYAASLSQEKSDGVSTLRPGDQFGNYNPDRDGYTLNSSQARVGFSPAAGQRIGLALLATRLNARYDDSQYLAPDYLPDNTADFRSRQLTQTGALDWRGTLGTSLIGSARYAHSLDDLTSGASDPGHYRTTRDELGAQLAWNLGPVGQLIAALEHGRDKSQSTAFANDVERSNSAVTLAYTGSAAGWSWQADLRHDDNSAYGSVDTGRLGGALQLLPGLRLRALAGTSFRAPSFNDLYYPGYGVVPGSGPFDIQPEKGRSVELGLDWRHEGSSAAFTVYRNRVNDLIGYQADRSFCPAGSAYDFGCAGNISRARLQGASLSLAQRFGALRLKAQLESLDARDRDTGERLIRRAAHQESLGADWTQGDAHLGASLLRLGARPDSGQVLAAETTLDLHASWRLARAWTLQAKLLNATDRAVQPARDYNGLGRQAWLGLRFEGGL